MPWMSSVSSRHGTHARVERVLRELHAGPAAWARRMRALLRPDRWRDAMPPLLARRRVGGRDGADLLLDRRGADAPRAGRIQALRRMGGAGSHRWAGRGALAPRAFPRAQSG